MSACPKHPQWKSDDGGGCTICFLTAFVDRMETRRSVGTKNQRVAMMIEVPNDYVPITVEVFERFLKTCPDYTRAGYGDSVHYAFRHNQKQFAVVTGSEGHEKVFFDPTLLNP